MYTRFLKVTTELTDRIKSRHDTLVDLLLRYEPLGTVKDEIDRSLSALQGVGQEFAQLKSGINGLNIATFFPLNLPLYSLVIFAVIPSGFAKKVFVRASASMQPLLGEINDVLGLKDIFPNITIKNVPRQTFLALYAGIADVILFTGRCENALAVKEKCPGALLIFNGSGVNPAIVFKNADTALAADKIFEMRIFNSGQDCAGTDAIFVHEDVLDQFLERLRQRVDAVRVGNYGSKKTEVGPIQEARYVAEVSKFFDEQHESIVYGGKVNTDKALVYPTIIVKKACLHTGGFHEFFAPVFYVLPFKNPDTLRAKIKDPAVYDYSMYITYFGQDEIVREFTAARLLHNCIINDVEQGNLSYGGYGKKANFVTFGSKVIPRPLLISQEIDSFYCNDGIVE